MEPYQVILSPIVTEAVFDQIELHNKIVFYVHPKANKNHIRLAFTALFDVIPIKINTSVTPKGKKKAFIKLPKDVIALDLATDFGMF